MAEGNTESERKKHRLKRTAADVTKHELNKIQLATVRNFERSRLSMQHGDVKSD